MRGVASVVEQVRTVASRVAAGYGLEIFDVQFRREAPGMVLRVQIDRPGPAATAEDCVSVEDCARVSRELSGCYSNGWIGRTCQNCTQRRLDAGTNRSGSSVAAFQLLPGFMSFSIVVSRLRASDSS